MNQELEKTTTLPVLPPPATGEHLELTATQPEDIQHCQQSLIAWLHAKINRERFDADELEAALAHAIKRKWKSSTLDRHHRLARKRVVFYEKVLVAVSNGYVIVPNFPVTLFAIRTNRSNPKSDFYTYESNWNPRPSKEQEAPLLPAGEGEYQNPFPVVCCDKQMVKNEKGELTTQWDTWADRWADFEFPISMAKLHMIQVTERAMALKVFDEIGVLPTHRREPDPVIVGRIVDPRHSSYESHQHRKAVSFILAWHLDTRTL